MYMYMDFHFTSLACQSAFTFCANFCGIRVLHPPLGVAAAHFHFQPDMYIQPPPFFFGRHKFHLSVHCFGVWKSTHQKIPRCSCIFRSSFVRVILIPLMDEWIEFGYYGGLGGINNFCSGYYLGF